jgi:hypothetical protein
MTSTTHQDREARKARTLARRANWRPAVSINLNAADVVAGDFIERIPAQGGVRGSVVMSTVTAVEVTHDEWGQRSHNGRKHPVEGRRFSTVAGEGLVDVTVPATFTVVVRRASS